MAWLQLAINTTSEETENVEEYLTELGAKAFSYSNRDDKDIFEPKPNEVKIWDKLKLISLFDADIDVENLKNRVKNKFNADFSLEPLEVKDWTTEWMSDYQPINLGNNLWIIPSWLKPVDESATNVILNPGLAFGTGTHPTTNLCLEYLGKNNIQDLTVLDYGCGSGILAIAALKLGAKKCFAVDYDLQALQSTFDNANLNNLDDNQVITLMPNQSDEIESCDLIMANILANPLIELAPIFKKFTKQNTKIILSGLLEKQIPEVTKAYSEWVKFDDPIIKEEWVLLTGEVVGKVK
jgi:ribosomal protein L11 methyltransferase